MSVLLVRPDSPAFGEYRSRIAHASSRHPVCSPSRQQRPCSGAKVTATATYCGHTLQADECHRPQAVDWAMRRGRPPVPRDSGPVHLVSSADRRARRAVDGSPTLHRRGTERHSASGHQAQEARIIHSYARARSIRPCRKKEGQCISMLAGDSSLSPGRSSGQPGAGNVHPRPGSGRGEVLHRPASQPLDKLLWRRQRQYRLHGRAGRPRGQRHHQHPRRDGQRVRQHQAGRHRRLAHDPDVHTAESERVRDFSFLCGQPNEDVTVANPITVTVTTTRVMVVQLHLLWAIRERGF